MNTLKNKTLFITGASRGIGKEIALRAAQDGANIAVVAKTAEPNPKLPGTVYSAVEDIEKAGGKALACITDIRFENQVQNALEQTVNEFGGIDILVNNASAIDLSQTPKMDMKKFDLLFSVNVRGTFMCSKLCFPYLKKGTNPHILNLSPPLNLNPEWFKRHLAYTMSKYGMSMCVLGMAEEFKKFKIAVNALWPRTAIGTSVVKNLFGGEKSLKFTRKPQILADAAYVILTQPSEECTGNFFIDDEVLAKFGITDLDKYSFEPNSKLATDFFIDDDEE